jgi:hypothetical protein
VEVGLRFAMSSDEPGLRDVDPLARGGDVERIAFLREAVASGRCLIAEAGFIVGFIVSAPRHFFDRDFIGVTPGSRTGWLWDHATVVASKSMGLR